MQNALGRGITGAANLAFLFMLISGLCLWLLKMFNIASLRVDHCFGAVSRKGRAWNWHNVIGIWTTIPLLFIVGTDVAISYPWASNLLYAMTGTKPPTGGRRGERGAAGNEHGRAPNNQ